MVSAICFVVGLILMAGAFALMRVAPPEWRATGSAETRRDDLVSENFAVEANRALERWSGFQKGVRRCTNTLIAITGGLIFACAFITSNGRVWMGMWLLIFLAMLTVILLAGLDAFASVAGYRQAIPEAARRSFSRRQPHP